MLRHAPYLKQALIVGWLATTSNIVFAQGGATPQAAPAPHSSNGVITSATERKKPKLYGSKKTLQHIEPFRNIFMRLSGINTIVFSRGDIIKDEEKRALRIHEALGLPIDTFLDEDDARQRVKDLYKRYPSLFSAKKITKSNDPIGKSIERLFRNLMLDIEFAHIAGNHASSQILTHETSSEKLCEITAPSFDNTPEKNFLRSTLMPPNLKATLPDGVQYKHIIAYIMFHEAKHCDQKSRNSEASALKRNIGTLTNEIDADKGAFKALQEHLKTKISSQDYKNIIAVVNAQRSISVIRHGSHFLSKSHDFPTHITHVFDPDEKLDFTYNEYDTTVSLKFINSLLNLASGMLHGSNMLESGNAGIQKIFTDRKMSIHTGDDIFAKLFLEPSILMEVGREINNQNPALQYGLLKALRDIIPTFDPVDKIKNPLEYKIRKISTRLIANYLNAIDTYLPEIQNTPLAEDVYDMLNIEWDKIKSAEEVTAKKGEESLFSNSLSAITPKASIIPQTSKEILENFSKINNPLENVFGTSPATSKPSPSSKHPIMRP